MIVMEMVRINNFDNKCPVIGKCHIKNYRMKGNMNFIDKKNISHGTVHPSQAWCWFSEPNQTKSNFSCQKSAISPPPTVIK